MKVVIDAVGIRGHGGAAVLSELLLWLPIVRPEWEWHVFLLDRDLREFDDPVVSERVTFENTRKGNSALGRLLWVNRHLPSRVEDIGADLLFSFANMAPCSSRTPQVVFNHQPNAFFREGIASRRILTRARMRYLRRQILRGARASFAMIVQTAAMRKRIGQLEPRLQERLRVIPSGYRTPAATPIIRPEKKALIDNASRPRLVYVSYPHPHKNHLALIRALPAIVRDYPDVSLLLTIGFDAYKEPYLIRSTNEIRGVAENSGEANHLVWLGGLNPDEVLYAFQNSDLLVFPSLAESFGLPLVEAMAANCPVVASDLPYAHDIVGDAGAYFDPSNSQSLAEVVIAVLKDPDLRSKMKQKATDRKSIYCWTDFRIIGSRLSHVRRRSANERPLLGGSLRKAKTTGSADNLDFFVVFPKYVRLLVAITLRVPKNRRSKPLALSLELKSQRNRNVKTKTSGDKVTPKACVVTGIEEYPAKLPYCPSEDYPEFRDCTWAGKAPSENLVYAGVRNTLFGMGLDSEHYGTSEWNPLSDLAPPGGRVTIKPNMVRHWNENKDDSWQTVVTHWAVVRVLVDYALLAVGPKGHVTIGDAPQWDCNMETLKTLIDVPAFLQHYDETVPGQVSFVDFRPEYFRASGVTKCESCSLPGDPRGYVLVDLKEHSMFAETSLNPRRFYGAGYDNRSTVRSHSHGHHKYLIAKSALDCDLFVNVPKLKTHHLLGLTVAMKNLVGINGDKNYLPHFRLGFTSQGGDQYPKRTPSLYLRYCILKNLMPLMARSPLLTRMWGRLLSVFHRVGGKNPYAGGGWLGNDTVWRMTLDLNRILLYARSDGVLSTEGRARRYLTLVDGIVGGEGEGPMDVQRHKTGILLAASDPLACDMIAARIMGFDIQRLRFILEGLKDHEFPISSANSVNDLELTQLDVAQSSSWRSVRWEDLPAHNYIPPVGWKDLVAGQVAVGTHHE